jgi:hypothetical protein
MSEELATSIANYTLIRWSNEQFPAFITKLVIGYATR